MSDFKFFEFSIGFMIGVGTALCLAMASPKGTKPYNDGEIAGYKQGQVDYANGKIKYKLVKQPDNTVKWKKIDNE